MHLSTPMNRKQRHCILQMGLAYDAAVGAQTNGMRSLFIIIIFFALMCTPS